MLLESIGNALSFNIAWFIDAVLTNLLWVFILAAVAYFIFGKSAVILGLFIGLYLNGVGELLSSLGWVFGVGFINAFVLVFIFMVAYDSFSDKKLFQKNWGLAFTVSFWLLVLLVNV